MLCTRSPCWSVSPLGSECSPRMSCYWPSPFAVIFLFCCPRRCPCYRSFGYCLLFCHISCYLLPAGCSPHAFCIGHCHWLLFGHAVHRMLFYLPSNANFPTTNAILRPARHTLATSRQARPEDAVSGSSTRRTTTMSQQRRYGMSLAQQRKVRSWCASAYNACLNTCSPSPRYS